MAVKGLTPRRKAILLPAMESLQGRFTRASGSHQQLQTAVKDITFAAHTRAPVLKVRNTAGDAMVASAAVASAAVRDTLSAEAVSAACLQLARRGVSEQAAV